MTYSKNSKIEAADFNGLVGLSTSSTVNELNALLGVGNGSIGYGQSTVPQVATDASVVYNDWANLVNKTSTLASHQGTAITSVTVPTQGLRIDYNSAIVTNLSTISSSTARLSAAAQGTTTSTATSAGTTWSNQLTFTHTVTFASGNAARYFFNAGGQLAISFYSPPGGTAINTLMNSLATACGTIVLSSTTSGTISIGGTSYTGITKIGGSGTPTTLATNSGYYGLSTSDTLAFKQLASGSPAGYINSFISVNIKTNGATVGGNGDTGSVITITTIWDEVPNGLAVAVGTATTVTVRPPSLSYLSNSWGTPTVVGSVTGS